MFPVKHSLAVIYLLSIWIARFATGCGNGQIENNGRCCDLCPPGKYLVDFCSEGRKTACAPCKEGYFSDQHSMFAKCDECLSCQHDYAEKCTPTTNAKCSCHSGFLCSNNDCSACEENRCVAGEKVNRTEIHVRPGLIKYSYQCVPACPGNAYLDVKENICKSRTQCSVLLPEVFPGNNTHDSVCDVPGTVRVSSGGNYIYVILAIGFVLLSLSLLVFITSASLKNLRRHKPNSDRVLAVSTNTTDFHLSKEESGLERIFPGDCKDSGSFGEVTKVTTL